MTEVNGPGRNEHKAWRFATGMQDVIISWFPVLVLMIMTPLAVYLPNQKELGSNLTLVVPFVLAGLAVLPLLFLLLALPSSWRDRAVTVMFYFGVFLALCDVLAPVQLGAVGLQGEAAAPYESLFLTLLELLIFMAVCLAAIRLPVRRFRGWASLFIVALLVVQVAGTWAQLAPDTVLVWNDTVINLKPGSAAKPPSKGEGRGNIYQICFDEYTSAVFLDALKELNLAGEFDGFTFFRKNRSNYIFTMSSLPSFFTGTFYTGGNGKDWDKNRTAGGMVKQLYDHGFTVSMYVPDKTYLHDKASVRKTRMDLILRNQKSFKAMDFDTFAHFWLVRAAPNVLREEVYRGGKPLVGRLVGRWSEAFSTRRQNVHEVESYAKDCVPLMQELLADEEQRPDHDNYVYAHLTVTHWPWGRRNRDCQFLPNGGVDYFDHALCATKLMVEFITKLKALGRYEQSTIIFHSDHGVGHIGPKDMPDYPMAEAVAQKVSSTNKFSSDYTYNRTYALLVVKPPGKAGTPMEISESPTMLADIPATVYDFAHLPVAATEGLPVRSLNPSMEREVPFFVGFVQSGGHGQIRFSGKELFEGDLCHFSYTNGKGWKLYPDIPFEWK